jgi:hypothetical protein
VDVVLQELDQQSDYVGVTVDMGVHGDGVRQVAYFPDNEMVASCSQDPSATLVIRHVAARKTPYIFKLSRVGIARSGGFRFKSSLRCSCWKVSGFHGDEDSSPVLLPMIMLSPSSL